MLVIIQGSGEFLLKQRVLFIYNWVTDYERINEFSECASTETVNIIKETISSLELEVIPLNLRNHEQLTAEILKNMPIDLAFVIAEGFLDQPSSLYDGTGPLKVREILEIHQIPYTHSGVEGMEVCRNKDLTYRRLGEKGINIPRFVVFADGIKIEDIVKAEQIIGYPMFLKPSGGGNSMGIDEKSIVKDRDELITKLNHLQGLIGKESVIGETYLSDREYTVGVIGNEVSYIMPIIAFPDDFTVRSQQIKKTEYRERDRFEIVSFTEPVGLKIHEIARQVFEALGVRDIIRIDLKQDGNGNLFVIDVNGTPSLAAKGSFAYMAEKSGISHRDFVAFLLYITMTRYSVSVSEQLSETALKVMSSLRGNSDHQVA